MFALGLMDEQKYTFPLSSLTPRMSSCRPTHLNIILLLILTLQSRPLSWALGSYTHELFDISSWAFDKHVKLNILKRELLPPSWRKSFPTPASQHRLSPVAQPKNLGIIFDSLLLLTPHPILLASFQNMPQIFPVLMTLYCCSCPLAPSIILSQKSS